MEICLHRYSLFCHNQGISLIKFQKSVLICCKVEFDFFLSGIFFANIHNSQNNNGRGDPFFMTCLICSVSVTISLFNFEEFIYEMFEDCIGLDNSQYCSSYFRISMLVLLWQSSESIWTTFNKKLTLYH